MVSKNYECLACRRAFTTLGGLLMHCDAKGHRVERCLHCDGLGFPDMKKLILHKRLCPTRQEDSKLDALNRLKQAWNIEAINQQLTRYRDARLAEKMDDKVFAYTPELLDENDDSYCGICGKFFVDNAAFRQHLAKMHHWCFNCSKGFNSDLEHVLHEISPVHNEQSQGFNCPFCRMKSKTASSLTAHLESECRVMSHSTVTNHIPKPRSRIELVRCPSCSICGREVGLVPPPINSRRLECLLCFKCFSTPDALISHLKMADEHTGLLFICPRCEEDEQDVAFEGPKLIRAPKKRRSLK